MICEVMQYAICNTPATPRSHSESRGLMGNSSRISGFYKLTPAERRRIIVDWPAVSPEQRAALEAALAESGGLALAQADKMV